MSSKICPHVVIFGKGGREYALAMLYCAAGWKVSVWPGYPTFEYFLGPACSVLQTAAQTTLGSLVDAIARIIELKPDLVIIGPEGYLGEGAADKLRAGGINVFGPDQAGARLELDKAFSKEVLVAAGILTAKSEVFSLEQRAQLEDHLRAHFAASPDPIILKATGPAEGKGVTVARTLDEALAFVAACFDEKRFKASGNTILVEEYLGEPTAEFSVHILVDVNPAKGVARGVLLTTARDFKRVQDGDKGPNGGGSGTISPDPNTSAADLDEVEHQIKERLLKELLRRGIAYRGVIYLGLIKTRRGIYVLDFNCRFGDPEIQAMVLRHRQGLPEAIFAIATGSEDIPEITWSIEVSVYVVLLAKGYAYPEGPKKGFEVPIRRIEEARSTATLMCSGLTFANGDQMVADGGRILGYGATGETFCIARERAYRAIKRVVGSESYCREDIGKDVS